MRLKRKLYLVSYIDSSLSTKYVGHATLTIELKRKRDLATMIISKMVEENIIKEENRKNIIIIFIKEL